MPNLYHFVSVCALSYTCVCVVGLAAARYQRVYALRTVPATVWATISTSKMLFTLHLHLAIVVLMARGVVCVYRQRILLLQTLANQIT